MNDGKTAEKRLLGGHGPKQFMQQYWQKQPLLIRNAIDPSELGLSRDILFALATRDDVESRIVRRHADQWILEHGPFEHLQSSRGSRTKRPWTLLVQGANLSHEATDRFLRRFEFISRARLDDAMVSYAVDGGGVGPHIDSYDVFLLQVYGQRRWSIAPGSPEDHWIAHAPLRVLAEFQSQQEWLLEPGDMLYLPPGVAHDGVAVGECITCSIGFRAPTLNEMTGEFLHSLADSLPEGPRYTDPQRRPTQRAGRIDEHMVKTFTQHMQRMSFPKAAVADFLANWLSEPKSHVFFAAPPARPSIRHFVQKAQQVGLRLHRKSIMLYSGRVLCLNGESLNISAPPWNRLARLLRGFADSRELSASCCRSLTDENALWECLHAWHAQGWIVLIDKIK